jgi:hypothetical protein
VGRTIIFSPVRDSRDLYGLPLDRFVSERAALAKNLRSKGERERADEVANQRKPSVAAWAVNQLVRTQRSDVAELFKSGDQLQKAQSELLAGRGGADKLRAAVDRERAAVEQLTGTARGLLSSHGQELSATMLERVRETLHAAALDGDARAQAKDGCLERELRHVGMVGAGEVGPATSRRGGSSTRPGRSEARKKKAATDAGRMAERAARDLRVAEERRDQAADRLKDAEAAVLSARKAAERATHALEQASEALGKSER